jgi:hypothetical protein
LIDVGRHFRSRHSAFAPISRKRSLASLIPVENGRIVGVVEGVKQLLLSLARVGIDLSNPQFAPAIKDCVANLQSG